MMFTHLISSWEIMPQALVVCFGDVNFVKPTRFLENCAADFSVALQRDS